MRDHLGSVFDGTISSVTGFGLFVALDDLYVEGLIHVSELGADYYHFDAAKHQMLGERTGKRYRLGDRVKVKVVRVDMESTKIDFTLEGEKGDQNEKDDKPENSDAPAFNLGAWGDQAPKKVKKTSPAKPVSGKTSTGKSSKKHG
jgi:ribonuclease R